MIHIVWWHLWYAYILGWSIKCKHSSTVVSSKLYLQLKKLFSYDVFSNWINSFFPPYFFSVITSQEDCSTQMEKSTQDITEPTQNFTQRMKRCIPCTSYVRMYRLEPKLQEVEFPRSCNKLSCGCAGQTIWWLCCSWTV